MGETFELKPAGEGQEGDWVPIEDQSILQAKVLNAAKILMPFTDKDTGEPVWKVEFRFIITDDGKFNGRKIKGQTSTAFVDHAGCRLYQWVKTLLGSELPQGYIFDLDDVADVECFVQVSLTEKPSTKNPGEMFRNNQVIDVRPLRDNVPLGSALQSSRVIDEEPF